MTTGELTFINRKDLPVDGYKATIPVQERHVQFWEKGGAVQFVPSGNNVPLTGEDHRRIDES